MLTDIEKITNSFTFSAHKIAMMEGRLRVGSIIHTICVVIVVEINTYAQMIINSTKIKMPLEGIEILSTQMLRDSALNFSYSYVEKETKQFEERK